MRITEVVKRLKKLLEAHGDIECESDCPHCGVSFPVGLVVTAPETVRLNAKASV